MALDPYVEAQPQLPTEVGDALARGSTVLTANQRAAHTLRQAFDRSAYRAGRTLWTSPPIFALNTWLGSLWTQLLMAGAEDRVLLNRSQEQMLWRSIIAKDPYVTGLQSLDNLADLAAEAWRVVAVHEGRAQLERFAGSPDTQAFVRWTDEFERHCQRKRYLPEAALPSALAAALRKGTLHLPLGGLTLVDFLEQPPAHAHLFAELEQLGYQVTWHSTALTHNEKHLFVAEDDSRELEQAALWLEREHRSDPSARLALVVAHLRGQRARIERALAHVFPVHPQSPHATVPYEFSLGQPLSETAPAVCALTLLSWLLGPVSVKAISSLLVSPFFGGSSTSLSHAAAEFDAFELRAAKLLRPEFTLSAFLRLLERSSRRERLLPLLKCIASVVRLNVDSDAQKGYAFWADQFRAVLSAFSWTAAVERDSTSHQAQQSWESALDELSTLDFESAKVDAATALDALTRIASNKTFARESTSAAIQIVGPLELGGTPFDGIWFLAADDMAWPVVASPNPLLPRALQTFLGAPGADAERDATFGLALTDTIAHSAARVVFSYAVHGEDQMRRPSPMLAALQLDPFTPEEEQPNAPLRLESVEDCEPLPQLPEGVLRGGARILELQAACAFRAFAELRLNASQPEDLQHGFDARESGSIIHAVMQKFWATVRTQDALRTMSETERAGVLKTCIEQALERAMRSSQSSWERAYLLVQQDRLMHLLERWLSVELERPPFTVVGLEELLADVSIGPLRLKLRVDRIDETEGGPLIIDYKTGVASYKDWFGDRPGSPQLPLYGVLAEPEHLGGLAFAMLRAGKGMTLEGVAEEADVLAKSKPFAASSMAEQVQAWKTVLETHAQNFADGRTDVQPKDFPSTCQFCAQRLLCRLDTAALNDDMEDTGENVFAEFDFNG